MSHLHLRRTKIQVNHLVAIWIRSNRKDGSHVSVRGSWCSVSPPLVSGALQGHQTPLSETAASRLMFLAEGAETQIS